ncbi:MAG: DUF4920 domain-containing protein [Flavobacteriales bacterium]|nr:DUF4920 domain-containing protein [Flavobacteriales bacterium]
MKKIILLVSVFTLLFACKNNNENQEITTAEVEGQEKYLAIGDPISDADAISDKEMAALYANLKPGDTVDVKFVSTVNEVCQNKGCWMKMDLGEKEAMIKFKDYAFFMPKDIAGKEVILNGKAFVEEMSVDEQRHYAEDAGQGADEVAMITQPKKTLSFVSDGVLIIQ